MYYLNPLESKITLWHWLKNLKERDELELLIEHYVNFVLNYKILHSPSRGRFGEQGKDIVAEINSETQEFCSYVVKQGNLNKNLEGTYGILKQLEEAIFIELKDPKYHNKKRTAVVVYNGVDGNRSADNKYVEKKTWIEGQSHQLLCSPIEKWDLAELTDRILKDKKTIEKVYDFTRYNEKIDAVIGIVDTYKELSVETDTFDLTLIREKMDFKIKDAEDQFGELPTLRKMGNNE